MKSHTIQLFGNWLANASTEQTQFVDDVYALCEANYDNGGDYVVECLTPEDILQHFQSLNDVKEHCGLHIEQSLNSRWGEDNDSELDRLQRFNHWQDPPTNNPNQ